MKIPVVILPYGGITKCVQQQNPLFCVSETFLEVRATLEQWVCSTGSYHLNAKSTMSFHQFTQFCGFCTALTKTCDAHAYNAHFTGLARTWLFPSFLCAKCDIEAVGDSVHFLDAIWIEEWLRSLSHVICVWVWFRMKYLHALATIGESLL